MKEDGDYKLNLLDPDVPVKWEFIEEIVSFKVPLILFYLMYDTLILCSVFLVQYYMFVTVPTNLVR